MSVHHYSGVYLRPDAYGHTRTLTLHHVFTDLNVNKRPENFSLYDDSLKGYADYR